MTHDDGTYACGDATARVANGAVGVIGSKDSLDAGGPRAPRGGRRPGRRRRRRRPSWRGWITRLVRMTELTEPKNPQQPSRRRTGPASDAAAIPDAVVAQALTRLGSPAGQVPLTEHEEAYAGLHESCWLP